MTPPSACGEFASKRTAKASISRFAPSKHPEEMEDVTSVGAPHARGRGPGARAAPRPRRSAPPGLLPPRAAPPPCRAPIPASAPYGGSAKTRSNRSARARSGARARHPPFPSRRAPPRAETASASRLARQDVPVALDEHGRRGAARDRLEPDGAGPGVEVENARSRDDAPVRGGRTGPRAPGPTWVARPRAPEAPGPSTSPPGSARVRRRAAPFTAGGSGGANWNRSSSILMNCEYGSLTPTISTKPLSFSSRRTRKTAPSKRFRSVPGSSRSRMEARGRGQRREEEAFEPFERRTQRRALRGVARELVEPQRLAVAVGAGERDRRRRGELPGQPRPAVGRDRPDVGPREEVAVELELRGRERLALDLVLAAAARLPDERPRRERASAGRSPRWTAAPTRRRRSGRATGVRVGAGALEGGGGGGTAPSAASSSTPITASCASAAAHRRARRPGRSRCARPRGRRAWRRARGRSPGPAGIPAAIRSAPVIASRGCGRSAGGAQGAALAPPRATRPRRSPRRANDPPSRARCDGARQRSEPCGDDPSRLRPAFERGAIRARQREPVREPKRSGARDSRHPDEKVAEPPGEGPGRRRPVAPRHAAAPRPRRSPPPAPARSRDPLRMRAGRPLPVRARPPRARVRARGAADPPRRRRTRLARRPRATASPRPRGEPKVRAGPRSARRGRPASGRRSAKRDGEIGCVSPPGRRGRRTDPRAAARRPRPGQDDRHRVDGKVATREVFHDRYAGLHVRQRARPGIRLAPRRRDVEPSSVGQRDSRRPESRVAARHGRRQTLRERFGETETVALEGEVDVPHRISEEPDPGRRRPTRKSSSPRSRARRRGRVQGRAHRARQRCEARQRRRLEDVLDRPLPRQCLDLARQARRRSDAHRVGRLERRLELARAARGGSRRGSFRDAAAAAPAAGPERSRPRTRDSRGSRAPGRGARGCPRGA